jgi:hypothetical protein
LSGAETTFPFAWPLSRDDHSIYPVVDPEQYSPNQSAESELQIHYLTHTILNNKNIMSMITSKNRWWIRGLFFGVFMFLFMGVLMPLASEEALTVKRLLLQFLYWLSAGVVIMLIISVIEKNHSASKKESSGSE